MASPPTPSLTPNPSPKGEGNFEGEGSRMKNPIKSLVNSSLPWSPLARNEV